MKLRTFFTAIDNVMVREGIHEPQEPIVGTIPGSSGDSTTVFSKYEYARAHDPSGKLYIESITETIGTNQVTRRQEIEFYQYPEFAAAGMYSSAAELIHVPMMINKGGQFDGQTVLCSMSITNLVDNHMGLDRSNNGNRYRHDGTNSGYRALLTVLPFINQNEINTAGIVVFTNGCNNIREIITNAIMDAYGW